MMLLQFFFPPVVLAVPIFGNKAQQEKAANEHHTPLSCASSSDDDDISLPSLGGLSIGSEHSCDELSHVELCHLLGPEVSQDELEHNIPAILSRPANLEHTMTMDLPVGYYRLRRAFLSENNDFWDDSVLSKTLQYTEVSTKGWDHHSDIIGLPSLPNDVKHEDIIGASKKTEYLMPKTKLVKANMAYETATITEYNDHCFALEMFTTNPDVPFGKRFIAHTKIVVYNTGSNTCQMECSVETDFPQGPPMGIAWKIKDSMKNGSLEVFHKIGLAIKNCAITYGWV